MKNSFFSSQHENLTKGDFGWNNHRQRCFHPKGISPFSTLSCIANVRRYNLHEKRETQRKKKKSERKKETETEKGKRERKKERKKELH